MIIGYIDSNIVLSLLLEDDHYGPSLEKWQACSIKLSSELLDVETFVNLNRYGKAFFNDDWIAEKIQLQEQLMEEVSLRPLDQLTIQNIKTNRTLTECKTLDALHLSTALIFRDQSEDGITMITHDTKMKQIASQLGFAII